MLPDIPNVAAAVQDFVKWRAGLVHFFLCALVDPSPDVAALATHVLHETVATKVAFIPSPADRLLCPGLTARWPLCSCWHTSAATRLDMAGRCKQAGFRGGAALWLQVAVLVHGG